MDKLMEGVNGTMAGYSHLTRFSPRHCYQPHAPLSAYPRYLTLSIAPVTTFLEKKYNGIGPM